MSDSLLVFGQDYPVFILVLAIGLVIGLVAREWLREFKRNRILRSLAALLLGIAVLGIIYRPAIRRSLDKSNLIVLTDGFIQIQYDSLSRALPRADLIRADSSNAFSKLDEYGTIYVLGHGIASYDLWKFEGHPTQFLGGERLQGLTRINFPNTTNQDRKLSIKGEYHTDQANLKLYLEGKEGRLDSAIVTSTAPRFELSFVPKTVGNFIYTITDESGTFSEKVPLVVQPSQKLKVLMINAFPTFETRYLKNYLARKGNAVTVRNQVSKGVYRKEFYNTPEVRINQLTDQLLTKQDILIFDWQSLNALNATERTALNDAIQEEGVGMFIQPEDAVFRNSPWLSIERIPIEDEIVSANLAGTAVTLARYSFQLRKSDFQIALLEDDQHLFALAERKGLGKIGTSMLRDTYRQNLTGDSLVYANIWSELLSGLAKQNETGATLMAQNKVVYPLEPYHFEIQRSFSHHSPSIIEDLSEMITVGVLSHHNFGVGDQSKLGQRSLGIVDIPMQQNAAIPEHWQGTYWSRDAGWQEMVVASDTLSFYIHEAGQWEERRAYDQVLANQQFFSAQQAQDSSELFQHKEIPVLWFYGLFLLSAGWLWLEPKV